MENACTKVPLQKQKVLINYFNLYIFFKNLEKIFVGPFFLLSKLVQVTENVGFNV